MLCYDIMEMVGDQVELIRNRNNYNKCIEELIQVRDNIIERGFMGDWKSPILKYGGSPAPEWCYLREWIYQEVDKNCGEVEIWSQDPESIISLWYDGSMGNGEVVDGGSQIVSWKNTPELPGFEPTDWGRLYSINVFKWGEYPCRE